MRVLLILALLLSTPAVAADCVVLLHGLARSAASMRVLQDALLAQGYSVSNLSYPSRQAPIETLAPLAVAAGLNDCATHSPAQIHVVTHSLGGILLRAYLRDYSQTPIGRVVMLGPPNQGSQVVDHLRDTPGFAWFNGPAGLQLGTAEDSVPKALGPVDFELGVIAGSRSVNLLLSTHLPVPNDGKVAVAATRVSGMTDHVTLPVSHTFMMRDPAVIEQVLAFLADGKFGDGAKDAGVVLGAD